MLPTNAFRALRELLPEPPLLRATVVTSHTDGTVTVEFPGGGQQRVRGDITSGAVYVRNGVIEGEAPDLDPLTIEE